ncbi:ATP-binding protein [Paenibacillus lupini]|uniref:ATP-binding protein n=1 Tax=Paenibacillus lupini TaxID=1450204 RepID=UPI0014218861|nr:ATP-binding protein [Paenibacillus lupini]NIK23111.1 hypothetical protein [Paenibacillus lupini]
MNKFEPFDPLEAKHIVSSDVATRSVKREILNILASYVGWFDPFAETIQNALDSIEERAESEDSSYIPSIFITIDIQNQMLFVTDNGVGLDEQKYKSFLAPDFSFKSGKTRGHKGVGATYLAYGFNFMQVCTKTPDFSAVGKLVDARKWILDESPSGNPEVRYDETGAIDDKFKEIDKGVSICLKFDKYTHPKDLGWLKVDNASAWMQILSVKTGLGAFRENKDIRVELTVFSRSGEITSDSITGINYLWPHTVVRKSASIREIESKRSELFDKGKDPYRLPSYLNDLDMVYEYWGTEDLISLAGIDPDSEEMEVCIKFSPSVYFAYTYTTKVWDKFNQNLNVRSNYKILQGGIQLAANNMPQGEVIQIPLKRYIGRQHQVHAVFHFDNCSADLGRKGFQSEIVEFSKEVSRKLIEGALQRVTSALKSNTGVAPDLLREKKVEDWKDEMMRYENENPLTLISEHFFLPLKTISITSQPTREQDVIALFNQLIAGGVIRGVRIMSTNERFTYDGLYRIIIAEPLENHIYNNEINPLGVLRENTDQLRDKPFISGPKILEYKYSLDGLIENIHDGSKNSNDIGLVVVWETGESYKGNYKITSMLDQNNISLRQYHGLTHVMTNVTTGQREMDLIVLKEMIDFLNDPISTQRDQVEKYED